MSAGTPARYASRLYACNGGRYYTYAGGWGCALVNSIPAFSSKVSGSPP
jgi:hypothetical protein